MRGDEPDRHAYVLDCGQIIVYLSRTLFQCMPEKATCQPTLAVHYRRLSSTQVCLKHTDFSGSSLCNSIDVQVALNDLQARFPNDELINEAVHLNSNTE